MLPIAFIQLPECLRSRNAQFLPVQIDDMRIVPRKRYMIPRLSVSLKQQQIRLLIPFTAGHQLFEEGGCLPGSLMQKQPLSDLFGEAGVQFVQTDLLGNRPFVGALLE